VALQLPNHHFIGTITRTAQEFDSNTRTLLTEIQLPNPDRILLPGMYVDVTLNNASPNPPIVIPGDALLVRSNGTQVAVAQEAPQGQQGNERVIHLVPVAVGRDFGTQIEIVSGLKEGDLVVNPNDDVREGAKVNIQASKENPDQRQNTQNGKQPPNGPGH
jgi:hypothetical protein